MRKVEIDNILRKSAVTGSAASLSTWCYLFHLEMGSRIGSQKQHVALAMIV